MDALKLIESLSRSDVVQAELPLGMQLGLPWLEKRGGRLCIRFLPHREELVGEELWYYPPRYEIAWVWPFAHLDAFTRLAPSGASEPLCKLPVKRLLSSGKYALDELYRECGKILSIQESRGEVTDAWLHSYQKKYRETVSLLRLEDLYKKE